MKRDDIKKKIFEACNLIDDQGGSISCSSVHDQIGGSMTDVAREVKAWRLQKDNADRARKTSDEFMSAFQIEVDRLLSIAERQHVSDFKILEAENDDLQHHIKQLEEQIEMVQRENIKLAAQSEQYLQQISQNDAVNAERSVQMNMLKEQIESKCKELTAKSNELVGLHADLRASQRDCVNLMERMHDQDEKIRFLEIDRPRLLERALMAEALVKISGCKQEKDETPKKDAKRHSKSPKVNLGGFDS